ncbi:MAG: TetR/AcrR family transcriptional regulator [Pseudomonadota bacterium]
MSTDTTKRSRAAQMDPSERRQQLLHAGVQCFADKGIGAAKHADIARKCGVSVPTVFSYFATRDELVSSVLAEVGNTLLDKVLEPARALPLDQQLAATAPLYMRLATNQPEYVKVWLMWSTHFASDIQHQFQLFETRAIDMLASMFISEDEDQDPEDLKDKARMLFASSAFLAKMSFDGISESRQQSFANQVLKSLAPQHAQITAELQSLSTEEKGEI